MRLTAVIPNRNHSALLPRSLGALQRQKRQPDEIIVVDDASTDNSRDVIREFMSALPQLRLLENPNRLGVVGAINRGLHSASGDAMYCGAADDATDPELIELLLGALERHPTAGLACGEARLIDERGTFLGLRPACMPASSERYLSPEETARLLRRMDNWVLSVVTVFRRDKLLASGGFDETIGSFCDSFLARRIALESGFVFTPRVLGTWFVQSESYSRTTSLNPERLTSLITICRDQIKEAEGATFPLGYSEVFVRRVRFASSRLAAIAAEFNPDLINVLADGGAFDHRVLTLAARLPRGLDRVAALGWLALRLRPTSFVGLIHSAALRWLRGTGDRLPG